MKKNRTLLLLLGLILFFSISKISPIYAQSNNIPRELLDVVTKIDLAGNNQDLTLIEANISPNFTNEDGLDYNSYISSLKKTWEKYDNLKYTTSIESWKREGNQLVATTITNIEGTYEISGKKLTINSQIKAEQYFTNNQLVKQKILTEKTEVTGGENPPKVTINLPEKVRPGQEFDFDVILQEPIGSDLILGAAIEDKINPELYLNPSTFELDTLSAGGIFKRVKMPVTPEDKWYSVILIRADGLRMITQRVDNQG
jgi:hypothetical protein